MKNILNPSLYSRLVSAEVVCKDCGLEYGKYSVGCSSSWMGSCDVCLKHKPVTEVRDYGYLSKGIKALQGEMNVEEEDDTRAYDQGEIVCKFTEDEVGFLNECLDLIQECHEALAPAVSDPEAVRLFENIEKKITELYEDNCVKYELAPALKAYIAKYGKIPGPEDDAKWEVFRDTYNWLTGEGAEQ